MAKNLSKKPKKYDFFPANVPMKFERYEMSGFMRNLFVRFIGFEKLLECVHDLPNIVRAEPVPDFNGGK